jgi:hypothetical protein
VSNRNDNDDWSNDSASLFRGARGAHDPTQAESARLEAVFARIQAGKAEPSFAVNRGADIVARGATSAMLRQIASASIGVVCIAAASFAFIRLNRQPSEPAHTAKLTSDAVVHAPPSIAMQPAPIQSGELNSSAQRSEAREEVRSRPRSQRHRSRGTVETQRRSVNERASAPEAPSSAPHDTTVTLPENDATRHERSEPASTVKAAAKVQQVAPRATSSNSDSPEPATPASREAAPMLPEVAPTELAIMKRIHGALRDADFSTVLTLCAEHARRWPHGVFELEREGVRAIASCGGNSDDAAVRAKRFLTAHPHAPVAMRVNTACAAQLKKR